MKRVVNCKRSAFAGVALIVIAARLTGCGSGGPVSANVSNRVAAAEVAFEHVKADEHRRDRAGASYWATLGKHDLTIAKEEADRTHTSSGFSALTSKVLGFLENNPELDGGGILALLLALL